MPEEQPRSGLIRAVQHEGAYRERARLHDIVSRRLQALSPRDPRCKLLRDLLDDDFALPPDRGPFTDLIVSTTGYGLIDNVEVGYEAGDTFPIRLAVYDGADDVVAYAYLTPEGAEEVREGLTIALTRAAQPEEKAAREAAEEAEHD